MDISVSIGEGRFNFRVAVILTNQGRVLLHKNMKETHWALPDGRVKMHETTLEAAVRKGDRSRANALVNGKLL